jgi:hypothetical protein
MDLAVDSHPAGTFVNIFPGVLQETKKLCLSLLLSAVLIIGGASFWGLYVATQVGIGVLISVINVALYALLAWTIIVKKNIAWMGPVIVIKYSILIASIYYVWTHHNVLLVLLGLIAQLIVSTLLIALIKGTENAF